jgi:hypothetical protein
MTRLRPGDIVGAALRDVLRCAPHSNSFQTKGPQKRGPSMIRVSLGRSASWSAEGDHVSPWVNVQSANFAGFVFEFHRVHRMDSAGER